jgi:hypothetical protein
LTGNLRASGTSPRRKYRPRTFALADGASLTLRSDGSIEQKAADGTLLRTLTSADPEWADLAIRFGIKATPATLRPDSREGLRGQVPG